MADSSRTDGSRARAAAEDLDRDEKIEQLLLAGLDHYFAARYEHAINVWTRALFLDRSHQRAHAYIERARTALAERQRRSEELLQDGVTALNRGHGYEARRLLNAAVEHGAPADDVHPLLERLNRESAVLVDQVATPHVRPAARLKAALRVGPLREETRSEAAPSRRIAWLLLGGVGVVMVGYVILGREGVARASLFPGADAPTTSSAFPGAPMALPLPRRSEMALDRARALALRGRLHEALSTLDAVHATDPEKLAADRLRSKWQHQLLGLPDASPSSDPASAPAARENDDKGAGAPR